MTTLNAKDIRKLTQEAPNRKPIGEIVKERIQSAAEKGFNSTRVWMSEEELATVTKVDAVGFSTEILDRDPRNGRINVQFSW